MSLNKVRNNRIIDLFPFPVEGRDVSAVLAETPNDLSSLGLTDVSREDWSADVPEHFPAGREGQILQVWAEHSGKKWFLVYSRGKETLFEVPLKRDAYEKDDRVYCERDPKAPRCFGTVESRAEATSKYVQVRWGKEDGTVMSTPIKDIALVNIFTPVRMPPV